jgi:hypothetical protein
VKATWCTHKGERKYKVGVRLVCACGAELPFGPANDTPVTRRELRAAELAQAYTEQVNGFGWFALSRIITDDEDAGWGAHFSNHTPEPRELAGWLAREIAKGTP